MPEFDGERNKRIRLDRDQLRNKVVLTNCNNCTIEDETFSYEGRGDQLELRDCVDCKVLRCTFHNRDRKGNFIHMQGARSRNNLIEGCTFKNHTYDGGNGGEAIIVGGDKVSGCRFKTKIRKCDFINCSGDDELVSIKSCDNIFENNNIHDDCRGNVTIRHGGFNTIQNNVFEGSVGGIRVLGDGNKIIGNHHRNNHNGGNNRRPLIIENGDSERDRNFNDNDEPIGREGRDHATYARAKNNIIEGNTYENCRGICVIWGRTDEDEKPRRNTFRNNTLIAREGRSEFLRFIRAERDENRFEDNKMHGREADRGNLQEREVERLESPPEIERLEAGP